MRSVTRFSVLSIVVALFSGAAIAQEKEKEKEKATTVILVRHAEKAAGQGDVELSESGAKRAECLANVLADSGVQAVITTEYKRTINTGAPLAKKLGITATQAPGAKLDLLIDEIKKHAGKTVVVVGHSNTVPAAIKRLGGGDHSIQDSEYDKLYIVTLANGQASTVALRYCQ